MPTKVRTALFVAALYLVGVAHWVLFFQYDGYFFRAYDWPKEYRYFAVVRDALQRGEIPYEVSEELIPISYERSTNKYLASPETPLSPQVLLLPFLGSKTFVTVNFVLLYSVGFVGLLLIARRYSLSAGLLLVCYALFNFNGYITAHLAVGHSMWGGYFLLPFLLLLCLAMAEEPRRPRDMALLALTMFAILLHGAFHMVIWCAMFLACMAVVSRHNRLFFLGALVLIVPLSAFRLLPAAVTLEGYPFRSGYPSLGVLLTALVTVQDWEYPYVGSLGFWEYDAYISLAGLLFILAGLALALFQPADERGRARLRLLIPAALLLVLAYGDIFYRLFGGLPLAQSQRVTSRMAIIPLLLAVLLACLAFRRMDGLRPAWLPQVLTVLLGVVLCLALFEHSAVWRMASIEAGYPDVEIVWAPTPRVLPPVDGSFVRLVQGTLALSAAALAGTLALALWPERRPGPAGDPTLAARLAALSADTTADADRTYGPPSSGR